MAIFRGALVGLLTVPLLLFADTKLPQVDRFLITSYALYNYDNLIADHFEEKSAYHAQLAFLLHRATRLPESRFMTILNSDELNAKTFPVNYMTTLNDLVKSSTGYYFVDR